MSLATCQSSKFHFKLVYFQILWNFCTSQKVPSFQCDLLSDCCCSALEMKIPFLGFTLSGLPKGAALWGLGHLGWTPKETVSYKGHFVESGRGSWDCGDIKPSRKMGKSRETQPSSVEIHPEAAEVETPQELSSLLVNHSRPGGLSQVWAV